MMKTKGYFHSFIFHACWKLRFLATFNFGLCTTSEILGAKGLEKSDLDPLG